MGYLGPFDVFVVIAYLALLLVLGFYLRRLASQSLENYLIGGRRLPWWALGTSGMAHFFDMTGTMIIVSFLYMLGPRGLFIEFRGGAVLVLVFFMLWTGKWIRRSQCMTPAEWMIYRFGDGFGGRFAQVISVIANVVTAIGMLAYLMKGAGLFLSMLLPYSPETCTLVLVGVATIYTMVSGFYGVVFTDVIQSAIIVIAVFGITAMAVVKVLDFGDIGALAREVTGNADWTSVAPHWKTTMPKGYEAYQDLLMFAVFYLLKNVFHGMGFAGDPKYFGARNDRECGLLTFLWTWLVMVRWPMMMGFAVLGIFLVKDLFPDQAVLAQAAMLIKQHVGDVDKAQWTSVVSGIIHRPQDYGPELIAGLKALLGESDWTQKLHLLSFEGTVNPERILPAVLLFDIPQGFRGLLLIALVAAAMSSFDSSVNMTTGLFTRDIYQKYIRPNAPTKELIYVSWVFLVILVAVGYLFAFSVESINDIWGWIIMGLGGGLLVPTFLRFYWWRFNGGGFAIGTAVGLCGAILQRLQFPDLDERLQFLVLGAVGLTGTIVGTYLTKPTDRNVLLHFFHTTRPFGLWGPLKETLSTEARDGMAREHRNDVLAAPFGLAWHITLFLIPMQLIIGAYSSLVVTVPLFIIGLLGLYFLWYRNLPPGEESVENAMGTCQEEA